MFRPPFVGIGIEIEIDIEILPLTLGYPRILEPKSSGLVHPSDLQSGPESQPSRRRAADWERRLSSRLGVVAARCRVGVARTGTRAQAQSPARRRGMGSSPAPAQSIARRGHRAPGAGSRLKTGDPSP